METILVLSFGYNYQVAVSRSGKISQTYHFVVVTDAVQYGLKGLADLVLSLWRSIIGGFLKALGFTPPGFTICGVKRKYLGFRFLSGGLFEVENPRMGLSGSDGCDRTNLSDSI